MASIRLRRTGWGIVESLGNSLHFIGSGTVTSNAEMDLASRLCQLHEGLSKVLHEFMPHEAAVEHTFVNKDATATLKLGQARGIALLAPAQAGLPVAEYAPNAVKKAVIGVGHGEKQQIHMMVKVLMPRASFDTSDAADALAIAICHAHHRQSIVSARRMQALLAGRTRMIGKLKGVIDEIADDHAVIDVHGVGYVAFCSPRTLGNLGGAGEAAILFIETYVREDMIRLYGFANQLEREWFRLLQNVQGVGAKVALAVLGTLSPSELANAIALRDIAMVSRAPGVGKKVAERIVTELKNKAPAFAGEASGTIGLKQELGAGAAPAPSRMPCRRFPTSVTRAIRRQMPSRLR